MIECEICSKPQAMKRVVIEGGIVEVCDFCASLGDEVKQPVIPIKVQKRGLEPYEFEDIVENYHQLVKEGRETRGLTRAGLAVAVKERLTVIERVENGRLIPDLDLARKLEKTLGISIVESASPDSASFVSSREKATVGDVVEIKK